MRKEMGIYVVKLQRRSQPTLIAEKRVKLGEDHNTEWSPNDEKIIYSIADQGVWAADIPKI